VSDAQHALGNRAIVVAASLLLLLCGTVVAHDVVHATWELATVLAGGALLVLSAGVAAATDAATQLLHRHPPPLVRRTAQGALVAGCLATAATVAGVLTKLGH